MRSIIAGHSSHTYLKPGEVIISRKPIMVSTILGSCVAITMYSPSMNTGAICHAVFPHNLKQEASLHYVDTAIRHIFNKMTEYGGKPDMVVKLFGGAHILTNGGYGDFRNSIGELNVIQARKTLEQLELPIAKADVGGSRGRKLLFSIKTGDVYLRRLKMASNSMYLLGE